MFRFTIRELVLLTVIVALAVGWSIEHRSRRTTERELVKTQELSELRRVWLEIAAVVKAKAKARELEEAKRQLEEVERRAK